MIRKNCFFYAVFLAGSFLSSSGIAVAGPFGLSMGQTQSELAREGPLKQGQQFGFFEAPTLRNGHPDLDDYRLFVTPETGLCKVVGWTPMINTSAYGEQVRQQFDAFQEALTAKYGAPKKFDFLQAGSIWNEPKDWMMGIAKKERTLAAYWTTGGLPDQLMSIGLNVVGASSSKGMVSISYEFNNFPECQVLFKAKKNSNL